MRRVIFFIAAVLTAAAALWSCQPEESRTSASVLKPVTIGEVVIPSSGGTSAFIYMIENPVEGGELSLEVPGDASWIVSTDISVQDTVLITAAPNPDTLSRSTTLTLNYESTFLLIKVLQRGTEMGDGGFAFNVTDVKTTMATVEVYPADKEMTYVAFSVAKEYMDGFESEEEFFLDDLEYMQSMADNAGVSLSTFLSEQALRTGELRPDRVPQPQAGHGLLCLCLRSYIPGYQDDSYLASGFPDKCSGRVGSYT